MSNNVKSEFGLIEMIKRSLEKKGLTAGRRSAGTADIGPPQSKSQSHNKLSPSSSSPLPSQSSSPSSSSPLPSQSSSQSSSPSPSPSSSSRVIRSIGDDCAVFKGESTCYLVTTDQMVEDIHFDLSTIDPISLGYKALAVNISDIAAMAGTPLYALVQLSFPLQTPQKLIENIYKGIAEAAEAFGVKIIGGDTTRAEKIFLGATLIGKKDAGGKNLRSSARSGDLVLVTGELGNSALGLAALKDPELATVIPAVKLKRILKAHRRPLPRIKEAQVAAAHGARAMIDISDGLLIDLGHILEESDLRAVIDETAIPYDRGAEVLVSPLGYDLFELATTGGEDYELIITASKRLAAKLIAAVKKETGTKVTVIGELSRSLKKNYLRSAGGGLSELELAGYDHFSGHRPKNRRRPHSSSPPH